MQEALTSFHRRNPLLPGLTKQELHTRFLAPVPAEVFEAILQRAISRMLLQIRKEVVSLHGFELLAKELHLSPEKAKQILYMLVRQGKAIKIAEDYFLHQRTWTELKEKIRALKPRQRTFSVTDFKALLGVSRKYAIPLLEHLDREGITRRSGNERII